TRHEPPREIAADGARTDEEPAANGERQRGLRAGLEAADALPRALDTAPDRAVEGPAARDLEVRESRLVENLGEPEDLRGRHPTRQRVLAEDADRRIHEA